MIKTSPMLDITAGLKQLKNVCAIHIVAVKNDVKELLWILKKDVNEVIIHCVNLENQQPDLVLNHGDTASIELSEPLDYLYEPNAAIMKSQAFGHLCEKYGVSKIDQDAHLFTGKKKHRFPWQNLYHRRGKSI